MRKLAPAAAALLASARCLGCDAPPPAPEARAFELVVLVTIDTLRADHLGAYGHPRRTSPFFDRLAARGVLFDRAYSAIATTAPSHATLFTSLYPMEHGLRRNGLVLADGFLTLAERLAAAGYETAAFVAAGELFDAAGLGQGFAVFDAPPPGEDLPYRRADLTVDAVLAWLDATNALQRPLFLFVHLFDPHGPLVPPEQHRERMRLGSRPQQLGLAKFLVQERHVAPGAFRAGLDGMLEQHLNYDAEIRFADAELRRLFRGLGERSGHAPALWVITADHGQGMGSHLWFGHGKHIYQEQVRVPLLYVATNGAFPARREGAVVEHVDLVPTLAELAGIDAEAGEQPIRGRSLAPLLRGEDAEGFRGRRAFVERRSYDAPDPARHDPDYELGEKFAVIGRRWKYIHRTLGEDELYDLAADPYETRNLARERREQKAQLDERLQARLEELRQRPLEEAESVGEEALEGLRSLGYEP